MNKHVCQAMVAACFLLVCTALAGAQDPVPAAPALPATAVATPTPRPKLQPLSVSIELPTGIALKGTLINVDQWSMKTSFGTTSLPLSAVSGVKFAGEGNATTTVVLHNGDSITGALELDSVHLETEWGTAEVRGTHITSVMFVPGLKWVSENGLGGVRWKLAAAEAPKQAPPPAPTARTGPNVAPLAPRPVAPLPSINSTSRFATP